MIKAFTALSVGVGVALSGCGSSTSLAVIAAGTVWESTDGGRSFDARITGIPQH